MSKHDVKNREVNYGVTVFCDDIRNELGGKHTCVGAYGSEMPLIEIPALLPKMGFAVQVVLGASVKLERVLAKVYFPGNSINNPEIELPIPIESVSVLRHGKTEDADIPPHSKFLMYIMLSPVEIRSEGNIKVRVDINESTVKCGVLRVRKVTLEEIRRIDVDIINKIPY